MQASLQDHDERADPDVTNLSVGAGEAVPLVSPARTWPEIRDEANAAFSRLAGAGDFSLGEELARFEEEFAHYCGVRHCVGVSDGTQALRLSLEAIGVERGSSVAVPANTFIATLEAVVMAGALPTLVDVDPDTRCLSVPELQAVVGDVAAVIPVHLYGRPAPMAELGALCERQGVPVIEDAAQAHGASLDGRRVGAMSRAGAFSFYPTKNLGAMGDGGAVVSDDEELAASIRSLRHHGAAPDDNNRHVRVGTTARLDNIQAAMLRLKLPLLDQWNEERRRVASRYREALRDFPLELPADDPPGGTQVHHLFVILVDERDRVLRELRASGIRAGVHYPTPVHLEPGWAWLGHRAGAFPVAERLAERCLSLPLFPGITEAEVSRVIEALARALR